MPFHSAPAVWGVRLAMVLLAVSIAWSPATAQPATGVLTGVVLASDSTPVQNAIVTLSPGNHVSRSDRDGRFFFRNLIARSYDVAVRLVGVQPYDTTAVLQSGQMSELLVVLQPVTLRSVTVSAVRFALPRVADRERRGMGAVMYADELQRLPLCNTLDVLNFSPRFSLGHRFSIVYVDGRPIRDIKSDLPHKTDIAAIEAQRGYVGIREPDLWRPREHELSWGGTVVLIWTVQYMRRAEQQRVTPF